MLSVPISVGIKLCLCTILTPTACADLRNTTPRNSGKQKVQIRLQLW